MESFRLARVHWFAGQLLLPEHFTAEEDSFVAELDVRARLGGLPRHGLASLEWTESGVIHIRALTAVLGLSAPATEPRGASPDAPARPLSLLVDVPGNTLIEGNFNLDEAKSSEVKLFLHVLEGRIEDPKISGRPESNARQKVSFSYRRAVLAAGAPSEPAIASLHLATFRKAKGGSWALSADYVPPLLLLGPGHPFLLDRLAQLKNLLIDSAAGLSLRVQQALAGVERSDALQCFAAVTRVQRMLDDMDKGGVRLHPYELHVALRDLYLAACCQQQVVPNGALPYYTHDAPASLLDAWMVLLVEVLRPLQSRAVAQPFVAAGDASVVEPMPVEALRAREVYLVVQRPDDRTEIRIDGLKLASRSRIAVVQKHALAGVPWQPVDRKTMPGEFGPADFYRLTLGDEWSWVVAERSLVFFPLPSMSAARVLLYWRG